MDLQTQIAVLRDAVQVALQHGNASAAACYAARLRLLEDFASARKR